MIPFYPLNLESHLLARGGLPRPVVFPAEKTRQIIGAVAGAYDIPVDLMMSRRRFQEWVVPRQMVYWLIRRLTGKSYPEIGRLLGRDHATILSGVRKAEQRYQNDIQFRRIATAIFAEFVS